MYESYNRRPKVKVTFGENISLVTECDLMGNDIKKLEVVGDEFTFRIRPFEVRTLKIKKLRD